MYEFRYDYTKPIYDEKSYFLKDNNDEGKKAKGTRKCVTKTKLKFEDYKNHLKASQFINKVNYSEKKTYMQIVLKKIKENSSRKEQILKTQQRFKSKRHNVFTEEINKIALGSNNDKRIQLVDSIETYAYGMKKDLIWKRGKNKHIKIIKH